MKSHTTRGLQSKQISGIIIHCVTVFHQREDVQFLKPCVELLKNLSSLKVSFSKLHMYVKIAQLLSMHK